MAINLNLREAVQEDKDKQDIYGISLYTLRNTKEIVGVLKENIPLVKDALAKSGGWVSKAAKLLSCTTLQLTVAISQTPALLESFLEIREKYVDFAESKLLQLVKQGNIDAIKFWLKCQGRGRGWIERPVNEQETQHGNFTINIEPAFTFTENKQQQQETVNTVESKTIVDIKQEYKKSDVDVTVNLKRNKLENVFFEKAFNDERLWQK